MYYKKFEQSIMKEFLIKKSLLEDKNKNPYSGYRYSYHETINPDNAYLSDRDGRYSFFDLDQIEQNDYYTYVYRIGVLYMWDANKCDFAEMHVAYQFDENSEIIYLGKLDFKHGENMDLETTTKRISFSMLCCIM